LLPQRNESERQLARRLKAVRAGTMLHQQRPGHAKAAGSLGGRACVARHPYMRSSAWGKALVRARELKRLLARVTADDGTSY